MTGAPVDVLLAEDSEADAELVLHSLPDGAAVRVHRVHDGEEALDFLFGRGPYADQAAAAPRLVLLDIKLPKVNGLEVLRELRRCPRTWALPVVLLTSSKVARDVADAYRLGVNSYVQKPVEFLQFRETVQRLGQYWLSVNEPPPRQALEEAER